MIYQIFNYIWIASSAIAGATGGLLGFMLWNSSLTNRDPFTTRFLKYLALCSMLRVLEIAAAAYRTMRIDPSNIPIDANAVGWLGRCVETTAYIILILFLLRPETKRALNGGGHQYPA